MLRNHISPFNIWYRPAATCYPGSKQPHTELFFHHSAETQVQFLQSKQSTHFPARSAGSCRCCFVCTFLQLLFRVSGSMACLPRTWLFVVHSASWSLCCARPVALSTAEIDWRRPSLRKLAIAHGAAHAMFYRESENKIGPERISFSRRKLTRKSSGTQRGMCKGFEREHGLNDLGSLSAVVTRGPSIKDVGKNRRWRYRRRRRYS